MANLCIIPARGGSKRIPRKNIKPFIGKPIIAYSIEAALASRLFDEVMVSTDDTEIAAIAKQYGAKVPFMRSEKNANDYATTIDVLNEIIDEYKARGVLYDNVCCIYPCAPFVTAEKLNDGFLLLNERKFDTVFPVVPFSFPIQRALRLNEGKLNFFQSEFALSRSQDLEMAYHDAGQFYWLKVEAFQKEKKIVTNNCGAITVSELEAQDIDNETDWQIAELKYQLLK